MRRIQWRILQQILNHFPIPDYIYGFEQGKSIPDMSKVHVNKDFVVSLDIEDFFPSIRQYMIQDLFDKAGIRTAAAKTLSELCTFHAFVPQGALTSPKISNILVAATFGPLIKARCEAMKLSLSIYADDITISGNWSDIFDSQPTASRRNLVIRDILAMVKDSVQLAGFRINRKKTKVMHRHQRQWVCGAVVNRKTNLIRKERLRLRAIIHRCRINGVETEAKRGGMDTLTFVRKYAGRLNWFAQLNPDLAKPLCESFKQITGPLTKMFPTFTIDPLAYSSGIESISTNLSDELLVAKNPPGSVSEEDICAQS